MSLRSNMEYPSVPKSITNPASDRNNSLDSEEPMSFLTFIKTITVDFDPEAIQKYYLEYIKRWNKLKRTEPENDEREIKNRYKEFIKDIALNYTTLEERKFLRNIDYDDPYDLEIITSFYSKKLLEICDYYKNKREDVKLDINRKKSRGSVFGTERNITELVLDHLSNVENKDFYYSTDEIRKNIKIELEELYDEYPLYFNQKPDENVFDYKDLDYGFNIFLKENDDIIKDSFSKVSDDLVSLKELDGLIDNKRELTEKYIFTDYYYLSTNSTNTEFLTGRLLESERPSKNIFNRDYPTTASTEKAIHISPREKGFFKPSKTSIILVDGETQEFRINKENLEPDKIYYFPDPSIIGTSGGILTFVLDDSFLKRNYSSGKASNEPLNNDLSNTYYGYTSYYEQNVDRYLSTMFDIGYVYDSKKDFYNNVYGLFKVSDNYNKNVRNTNPISIKNILLNGGDYFDELYGEGYGFDYSVYDDTTYNETIRSSLTSNTDGFSAFSSNLFFMRNFQPYDELIQPTEDALKKENVIRDGGFFTKSDLTFYDDPISSDLSAFPGNQTFYFNTLLEGGVRDADPLQRALSDPSYPSLTADFTESVRPSANNGVEYVDGGVFSDQFSIEYELPSKSYYYLNDNINQTVINLQNESEQYLNERKDLNGRLYIKNSGSNVVLPLLDTLPYLKTKHIHSVSSQLSSEIKRFELSNNTLFIETLSYMVIEPIKYKNEEFSNPNISKIVIKHGLDAYNEISNRFRVDNFVYYTLLEHISATSPSNDIKIYPKIYRYDLQNYVNELLFPNDLSLVTESFNISAGDIRYVDIDAVTLTHSKRNDIFNITFVLKDQNNYFTIRRYDFELKDNIEFIKHEVVDSNVENFSTILDSNYDTNLTVYMSATQVQNEGETLII